MRSIRKLAMALFLLTGLSLAAIGTGAYHHAGDADKDPQLFANVYPDKVGTKLDNCALCHTGGRETVNNKTTTYGSCQWCHYKYGYAAPHGDLQATLNTYGKAYLGAGRNEAALGVIESLDSDGDGYTNSVEIAALRYPGDAADDPAKVVAPFRIYTKSQLAAMPQHRQFMLMNTTKSGDSYAEYSGVRLETLLKRAGIAPGATQVYAYAPDGYAQRHPLLDSSDNLGKSYAPFVVGAYPPATYFYEVEADKAKTPYGWCDYRSAGAAGRLNGDPILVENGLRLLLALRVDGIDLVPGVLGPGNKLTETSEGPFRVVSPQKAVGPPDQASTASNQSVVWPYQAASDHNAGFATKCATMIKVEPLPPGTTDIDTMEAGWGYIDQSKLVVYGALLGPRLEFPFAGDTNACWHPAFFKWSHSPGVRRNEVVSYRLEYTKDAALKDWTVVAIERERKGPRWACGPLVKDSLVTTLEPGTQYWWRVTDLDENGGTTISDIRTFTTRAWPHKRH
jgi:hypothetical protein